MAWTSPNQTLKIMTQPKSLPPKIVNPKNSPNQTLKIVTQSKPLSPKIVNPKNSELTPIEKAHRALIIAKREAFKAFSCPCGCYKSDKWIPESLDEYEQALKKYRVLWCERCSNYQPSQWIVDKSKCQPGYLAPNNAYQLFCKECQCDLKLSLADIE